MSTVPTEILETLTAMQLDVETNAEQGLRDSAKLSGMELSEFVIALLSLIERHRGDITAYSRAECEVLMVCAATYLTQLCNTLLQEDEDQ